MKLYQKCLIAALLAVCVLAPSYGAYLEYEANADYIVHHHGVVVQNIQQQSTHMLTFLDKNYERKVTCTANSIGPHAILTAAHCNDGKGDDKYDTIRLDLSPTDYTLLAEVKDGHDHVIYLLDGPALKHFLPVESLVDVEPPKPGEHVHIYGDGEGAFPPRRLDGVENTSMQSGDTDVDADVGMYWYDLPVIHGDSGSAIYGENNRVLGCTTWSYGDSGPEMSVSMSLDFSRKVIQDAHDFAGNLGDLEDDNTSSGTKLGK